MASPNQPSARFRSATEFPKTVSNLSTPEANTLYEEMRDCLVFTNRSRAQLIRRNEEHKQSTLELKETVARLQMSIDQLNFSKQQLAESNQLVVAGLKDEIALMANHLDRLSDVFDDVSEIETLEQTQWGFVSLPSRFFKFIRAVRAIVMFWRDEQDPGSSGLARSNNASPKLPPAPASNIEEDRRENPQMYEDPASVGRSLLDR